MQDGGIGKDGALSGEKSEGFDGKVFEFVGDDLAGFGEAMEGGGVVEGAERVVVMSVPASAAVGGAAVDVGEPTLSSSCLSFHDMLELPTRECISSPSEATNRSGGLG